MSLKLATAAVVVALLAPSTSLLAQWLPGANLPRPVGGIHPVSPLPVIPLDELLPKKPPIETTPELPPETFCSERVRVIFQPFEARYRAVLADRAVSRIQVEDPVGNHGRATFFVALSTDLAPGDEVGGWQLGASVSDNLVIESLEPAGVLAGHELSALQGALDPALVDPSGNPQGNGFFTVAVLPADDIVRPFGTSTVLRVTVRTKDRLREGETLHGQVGWKQPWSTTPTSPWLDNVVTVGGESLEPCRCDNLEIEFKPEVELPELREVRRYETVPFRRGYVLGGTEIGMGDAMAILNRLYTETRPFHCEKSADANGDLAVDLSDAVYLLKFLYLGDATPPAPFLECGEDPAADSPLSCDAPWACVSSRLSREDLEGAVLLVH